MNCWITRTLPHHIVLRLDSPIWLRMAWSWVTCAHPTTFLVGSARLWLSAFRADSAGASESKFLNCVLHKQISKRWFLEYHPNKPLSECNADDGKDGVAKFHVSQILSIVLKHFNIRNLVWHCLCLIRWMHRNPLLEESMREISKNNAFHLSMSTSKQTMPMPN